MKVFAKVQARFLWSFDGWRDWKNTYKICFKSTLVVISSMPCVLGIFCIWKNTCLFIHLSIYILQFFQIIPINKKLTKKNVQVQKIPIIHYTVNILYLECTCTIFSRKRLSIQVSLSDSLILASRNWSVLASNKWWLDSTGAPFHQRHKKRVHSWM